MRRMTLLLTVVALVVLGLASPALAAPGTLDTSFGDDGTVATSFGGFSPGDDLAIQQDGMIVVAGGDYLARYNPDGSLDPTFDGDGKVVGSGGGDVAIQPDGKIVVVGQYYSLNSLGQLDFDFQVLRYNADGSPDATFDEDGRLATAVGPGNAFDSAHGVVVQADGKILVAGYSHDYNNDNDPSAGGNTDFAVVRYNQDGSLDPSFDGDGKLTTDFDSGQDFAADLKLQDDGKIVAAGGSGHTVNQHGVVLDQDLALARYNQDGSPDSSFGINGKITTTVGPGNDQVRALALQPDGRILAAGASQNGTESNGNPISDFTLARYNPDGSLDTSFHADGVLTTAISSLDDVASDLLLQDDGKIVVAGMTTVDGGGYTYHRIALARYNPDGSLDPLFGGDGTADGPEINQGVAAGLQSDGKILVSGTSTNQGQLLARFYGGEDATPPGPVTGLTADIQSRDVSLSWTNPADPEFAATRVLRSTTGFATGAIGNADQTKVYEGAATSNTDTDLPEGRYYYTAFARDGNGNYSQAATIKAIVDLAPPDTQILSGPLGDTNDSKPTFTFDAFDNLSSQADLLYSYRVDSEPWSAYSSATSATVGGTAGLADGPHTFYVRAKDESGKEDGSPAERTFTVDTQGPDVTITAGPSGTVSAGTARFEFSSSESAVDFECKLDDAPEFTPCFSPVDYAALSNGDHTFRVRGLDVLGNIGPTVSRVWTIAPETTSQSIAAGGTLTSDSEGDGATALDPLETSITTPVGGTVSVSEATATEPPAAGYSFLGQQADITALPSTADNPLRFVFTLDASLIPAGQDQNTIQVFRNGVQVQNCTNPSGTAASPDPCVLGREILSGGDVKFTVLTSHASRWNFGVDNGPPAAPVISSPPDNSFDTDGTIILSGTAEANSTVEIFDGTTSLVSKGTTVANSSGAWSKTLTGVPNGSHTYTARATDAANNTSDFSNARKVIVDTASPTVSGMSPENGSTITNRAPTIKATVTDNITDLQKTNLMLYVDGALISQTKYSYSVSTDVLIYNSPKLSKGKKTVKIVAKDAAGNVATMTWYFTIK